MAYPQSMAYPASAYPSNQQIFNVQPVGYVAQQPKSDLIFDQRWSNSLCDCCSDCKACCFALFCPLCFGCVFDKEAKECCCTSFAFWMCGCYNTSLALYRTKLRGAYKIEGSLWEDVCMSIWCSFCIWLQMHNEMKYRGDAE